MPAAMQVSINAQIYLPRFEKLSSICMHIGFCYWRIMNHHNSKHIMFRIHLKYRINTKLHSSKLTVINLTILCREIRIRWVLPSARSRNNNLINNNRVITHYLNRFKPFLFEKNLHLVYSSPPIIMITPANQFSSREFIYETHISHSIIEIGRPRQVAWHKNDIVFLNRLKPILFNFVCITIPRRPKNLHWFVSP